MDKLFEDKVVLITGASSGLGKALAYEFAKNGANVILLARRFELISDIADDLTLNFNKCIPVKCDVSEDEKIEKAVTEGIKYFGKIDIVVANAGFGIPGNLEDLTLKDYKKQFETNVFGTLRTIYATLSELKKSHGHICIIGSVNGIVPFYTGTSAYTMSKFAIRGLIEPLSLELSRYGISVTHIMPGFMDTEFDNERNDNEKQNYNWLKISAEKAAVLTIDAIKNKEVEVVLSAHGKVAVYLEKHVPRILKKINRTYSKFKYYTKNNNSMQTK